ncbi:glycosyltransferase family 25 protein [Paraferrimonas sedimenticola]|uniref:Glycosyl transferase family 25 domain-containing protein n=1 Tax=Paraferrimonas sedimenticola TaxID=375674 RepID=A0AA37RUP6_9GAMM|nr:glycosyltransferase family 25 protein [Paraferrimonas sedimenticola]GLP95586.1 hypothetical protein GCM10007895_08920 [Paraferrimonas sedimenticola]
MSFKCPILLINLDRSTDRLARCQQLLSDAGVEFERISAVDGGQLSEQQLEQYAPKALADDLYYRRLTPGEIGCYLSHRKAWQIMVERQYPYAIILEDDFEVSGDISQTIAHIGRLDKSSEDWFFLKLACDDKRLKSIRYRRPLGEMTLATFSKQSSGTSAQAVSLKGAKRLLKHSQTFARPIDIDLQHWWEKGIQIMGLMPFAFRAGGYWDSQISAMANRSDQPQNRMRRALLLLSAKLQGWHETRKFIVEQQERNTKF